MCRPHGGTACYTHRRYLRPIARNSLVSSYDYGAGTRASSCSKHLLEARNAALVARNTQRAIEAEQRAVELESHYRFAEAYRVARDAARVRRQLLEGLEVVEVRHAARAPRVKKQELVVLD